MKRTPQPLLGAIIFFKQFSNHCYPLFCRLFFLLILLKVSANSFAQSGNEKIVRAKEKVIKETNTAKLKQEAISASLEWEENYYVAVKKAREKGWPVKKVMNDGTIIQLMKLDPEGNPIYYKTENHNAAISTNTLKVQSGGGLGLSLEGSGITIGQWDGDKIRPTHEQFTGRVTQKDGATNLSSHSTHVCGTLIGDGTGAAAAKGMAPLATVDAYDFSNDVSEMSAAAAAGLILSNHSYGPISGWYKDDAGNWHWYGSTSVSSTESYYFGWYGSEARSWDDIAYNAPYYLIVKSAGNDRSDTGPTSGTAHTHFGSGSFNDPHPADCNSGAGYDCIPIEGVSKNILTVGAVNDVVGGYSGPLSVGMTTFSGWGPTDDGRIKPDIVGNGLSLYSADSDADNDYTTKSGTSMSSPNVAGSCALLQEHYANTHGSFMRAATLKALVIHTADECGPSVGPDYQFGWGLMNTGKAASFISDDMDLPQIITENVLTNGNSFTVTVTTDGADPLVATICWTDPPGTASSVALDVSTPKLVNDLDVRISDGSTTYYPYVLSPAFPSSYASTGDNTVDNVEQIYIDEPVPGDYTITITHKGTLAGGSQNFSMIIGGSVSPGCPDPDNLAANSISSVSAEIDWTPGNLSASWVMEYGVFGFTPGTGTLVTGTYSSDPPPIALSGFSSNTEYQVYLREICVAGSDSSNRIGPISFTTLNPPLEGCDTLQNVHAGDTPTLYGNAGGGYVAGHNGNGFPAVAEFFSNSTFAQITGADFWFGDAQFSSASSYINVTVWDVAATSGYFGNPNEPGNILATEIVLISDIANDISNSQYTHVDFSSPPTVNGDFYIGFQVLYAAGDTVGLVTNAAGESNPPTLWISMNNVIANEWARVDGIYSGLQISSYIFPEICSEQSILTCADQYFYDSGGPLGDYSDDENTTTVICPDNPGDVVSVDFTSFDVEDDGDAFCYDVLSVYDGPDAGYPWLGDFCSLNPPGTVVATDPSGCLTFVFVSDGSEVRPGWEAAISCAVPSTCEITQLDAGVQSACDPNTLEYTQEIIVTYVEPPATGTLEVNGQSFAITGSPQTVTLSGLPADGNDVDVLVSFSDDALCELEEVALFTAPDPCPLLPVDSCGPYTSIPGDSISNDLDPVHDTLTVSTGTYQTITDLNVAISISHTYLDDLTIELESPSGKVVTLLSGSCGYNQDLDVLFDDDGIPIVCGTPTVGMFEGEEPLAFFNGELFDGKWVLHVTDNAGGDDGKLIKWCLFPQLEEGCPPAGTPCDDGLACTVNDEEDGNCNCGGTARICDDGELCTTDFCLEPVGCWHNFNTVSCDDGDLCTINDQCNLGTCVGTPKSCDDGDPCTIDYCNASGVCVNDPDMAPPITFCRDTTINLDALGTATLVSYDLAGGSVDDCGISLIVFGETYDYFYTFSCANVGVQSVEVLVFDNYFNMGACYSRVTVTDDAGVCCILNAGMPCNDDNPCTINDLQDNDCNCIGSPENIPPVIANCPSNISTNSDAVSCGAVVNWTAPTGNDNCDGAVTPTVTTSPVAGLGNGSLFPVGVTTVNYDFTDGLGNSAVCQFTVTVSDLVPPVALCQDVTIQLDASGNGTITTLQADNGSSDNCGIDVITIGGSPQLDYTCADVGVIQDVALVVSDVHGNQSLPCLFDITVADDENSCCAAAGTACDDGNPCTINDQEDGNCNCSGVPENIPPVISNCPSGISANADAVSCGAVVNWTPPTGTDNCDGAVTPIVTTSPVTGLGNGAIFPVGVTSVEYTFTDVSGNNSVCQFTVTVSDLVPPVALCHDATVQLDGSGNGTITASQADNGSSDNCGIDVITIGGSLQIDYTCGDVGVIQDVALVVTDVNGNQSLPCLFDITIADDDHPCCAPAGTACDDGNPCTINDQEDGNCNCLGSPQPACAITIVQACDDGDPCTINDSVTIDNCSGLVCLPCSGQLVPGPAISSMSSSVLLPGQVITITGTNFSGTGNMVTIGGLPAAIVSENQTTIQVIVPAISCGGTVTVVESCGQESNPIVYSVPQPFINSVDPVVLSSGQVVTISGTHFGATGNIVTIGGLLATVVSESQTEIQAVVPAISCDGTITVVNCGQSSNSVVYTVPQPLIFFINPTELAAGQVVTISGINFGNLGNVVTIGGLTAALIAESETEVQAVVPAINCAGTLTVENCGQQSSPANYTVAPPVAICQDVTVQLDANGEATLFPSQVDNGSTYNCYINFETIAGSLQLDFTCSDIGTIQDVEFIVTDLDGNQSLPCYFNITIADDDHPCCAPAGTACDDGDPCTINDEEDGSCNCVGAPAYIFVTVDTTICPGQSLFVGGAFQNSTGTFYDTIAGTGSGSVTLAADINVGSGNSNPAFLTAFGNKIYFQANDGINGNELWSFDGTNATMEADIRLGSGSSNPSDFTVFGPKLYFVADDGVHGSELWSFDGTTAMLEADIYPGATGSFIGYLTVFGSKLYFRATDGVSGQELWSFDGATASLVADIRPGALSSGIGYLTVFGSKLYFQGDAGTNGFELYSYNGATVILEADIVPGFGSSSPVFLTVFGPKLYFQASDGVHGNELWSYDGTTAVLEADIYPGSSGSSLNDLIVFNSKLFFRANNGVNGSELWSFDGTNATLEADLVSGSNGSSPFYFVVFGPKLYFQANDGVVGQELWAYDGSTAALVADIRPGSGYSGPSDLVVLGSHLYFRADDGVNGDELWSLSSGCSEVVITNLTVEDHTPPVAICRDVTISVDNSGTGSVIADQADNGSFDNCGISLITIGGSAQIDFTCADIGVLQDFELIVQDNNGNQSLPCLFDITVTDTVAPVAICHNITVELDQSGAVNILPGDIDGAVGGVLETTSDTFNYTGGSQLFVVPPSVDSITIETWGASGAGSGSLLSDLGGRGGYAKGNLAVNSGDTLFVYVGGSGSSGFTVFNGGGNGFWDGGGATDVRTILNQLSSRLIVAGGGGGAGSLNSDGGDGGGLTGAVGHGSSIAGGGGGGGTQVSGGTGGVSPSSPFGGSSAPGGNGSLGQGGYSTTGLGGGGGGGGGYYGGGGGGTSTSFSQGGGGGGGSSYIGGVNNGITNGGVRSGSGLCVITYTINSGNGYSSDNCSINSLSVSPNSFDCSNIGVNTVTLTAVDFNGNSSTCSAFVTVEDTISPIAECQDITIQLNSSGSGYITGADIDGGSSDNCLYSVAVAGDSVFDCQDAGQILNVDLVVTDANNNSSICAATITISDSDNLCNQPPVAICQDVIVALDGNCQSEVAADRVDNGSFDPDGDALNLSLDPPGPYLAGITNVILSVSDGEYTITCSATITVNDSTPPLIMCLSDTVVVNDPGICGAIVNYSLPLVSDECKNSGCESELIIHGGGSGDDIQRGAVVDNLGNMYVVGLFSGTATFEGTNITSNGGFDIYLAKYDHEGNLVWITHAGSNGTPEFGDEIAMDNNGNIYITGGFRNAITFGTATLSSAGNLDFFLAKYDNSGNFQWVRQAGSAGGDRGFGLAIDQSDDIFVCGGFSGNIQFGTTNLSTAGGSDIFIAKYSPDGTVQWVKKFGGAGDDQGSELRLDSEGNIYLSGYYTGTVGFDSFTLIGISTRDAYLAKLNNSGITSWVNSLAGSTGIDEIIGVCVDQSDGSVYGSGAFSGNLIVGSTTLTSNGSQDFILVKYDSLGNLQWLVNGGTSGNDSGWDAEVDGQGQIFVTGLYSGNFSIGSTVLTNNGSDDAFLIKFDNGGNVLNSWTVGSSGSDGGESVYLLNNNIYFIGRYSNNAVFAGDTKTDTLASLGSTDAFLWRICDVNAQTDSLIPVLISGLGSGSLFPVGTTTEVYSVSDAAGNSATCSFEVTVNDHEPPVASCQNVTIQLDGAGNGTVTTSQVDNGSSDNCGIDFITIDGASQLNYTCSDRGTIRDVAFVVTDVNNNQSVCSFDITISDDNHPCSGGCPAAGLPCDDGDPCTTDDQEDGNCNCIGTTDGEPPVINCPRDLYVIKDPDTCGAFIATSHFQPLEVILDFQDGTTQGWEMSDPGNPHSVNQPDYGPLGAGDNILLLTSAGGFEFSAYASGINADFYNFTFIAIALDLNNLGNNDADVRLLIESPGDTFMTASPIHLVAASGWQHFVVPLRPQDLTGGLDAVATLSNVTGIRIFHNPVAAYPGPPEDIILGVDNIQPGAYFAYEVTATDNCSPVTVTQIGGLGPMSFFPLGVTLESFIATDPEGNSVPCSFAIGVLDTSAPIALCKDITIQLDATGNISINAADIDNGSTADCGISNLQLTPDWFSCEDIGTKVVTLTAFNPQGNQSSCTAMVTVEDYNLPVAGCQDIWVSLDINGSVSITANQIDNGSHDECGTITVSVSPTSFNCSNLGGNIVTLTVTDNSSNSSTCTAVVNVDDLVPPVVQCHDTILGLDASGNLTVSLNMISSYSDACSVISQIDPSEFNCASAGNDYIVTVSVSDVYGNLTTCSALVLIVDSTAPDITCQDVTVYLDFYGEGRINFNTLNNGFSDACGIASKSMSKSIFHCADIGTNIVSLNVTDVNGNIGTCTSTVTVEDTIKPKFKCSENIVVGNDAGLCGAHVIYNAPYFVKDNCGWIVVDNSLALGSGSLFPVGTTTETYSAEDGSGNVINCAFDVLVVDVGPPSISCPTSMNVNAAPYDCGAIVNYPLPTIIDNCGDGALIKTSGLGSGAFFPLGRSIEYYAYTDAAGYTDYCSFKIFVKDVTPPNITCPSNIIVTADPGECGAFVIYEDPVITDDCPGVLSEAVAALGSGAYFPIGVTTEIYEAKDTFGNISPRCSFTVTVLDNGCPGALKKSPESKESLPEINAFPNPFSGSTEISFRFSKTERVSLQIFDARGMKVTTLFEGEAKANELYKHEFEAYELPSGIYMYRIVTGSGEVFTGKLILLNN